VDGEGINTETYLALCYKCKLTRLDLEDMTIGMCLDYIDVYLDMSNPKKKKKVSTRKATQADYDSF
jgi:hypothetical protein